MKLFALAFFLLFLPYASFASTCVTIDVNGFVIVTGEAITACTDMVLLSKDEFTLSSSLTDLLTMSKANYEALASSFLILLVLAVSIPK